MKFPKFIREWFCTPDITLTVQECDPTCQYSVEGAGVRLATVSSSSVRVTFCGHDSLGSWVSLSVGKGSVFFGRLAGSRAMIVSDQTHIVAKPPLNGSAKAYDVAGTVVTVRATV